MCTTGYSAVLGPCRPCRRNTILNLTRARPISCCWNRWTASFAACFSPCAVLLRFWFFWWCWFCVYWATPSAHRSQPCEIKRAIWPFLFIEAADHSRTLLDVQPALLALRVLPPPAAGADVFADGDGARAGCAADAGIELIVQFVVRHIEVADIRPDVVIAPLDERIEFLQAVARVPLRDA